MLSAQDADADTDTQPHPKLKTMCFHAVRTHFDAVDTAAILDLPVDLINDLLPHLTICQLDQLQPALNGHGISTLPGWVGILQEICGPSHVIDVSTEEEMKHQVMKTLFSVVFYGHSNAYVRRNITDSNKASFLRAAAKCIKRFLLTNSPKPLRSLTEEQRPLLDLLEQRVSSVGVSLSVDLSQRKVPVALYVLHRLMDHGAATELTLYGRCPLLLAWILHGRGSEEQGGRQPDRAPPPPKRSRSSSGDPQESRTWELSVDPNALCRAFTSEASSSASSTPESPSPGGVLTSSATAAPTVSVVVPSVTAAAPSMAVAPPPPSVALVCPWGQVQSLEISQCDGDTLRVLNSALPTFFCLRSLTLHSISTFGSSEVGRLAAALRRLSQSRRSRLTGLSIGALTHTHLLQLLLDASPALKALSVEVQNVPLAETIPPPLPSAGQLPLETLTLRADHVQTRADFVPSLLRRCPLLSRLCVGGVRLPSGSSQAGLLEALAECSGSLRSVRLEDVNLSDCQCELLKLLRAAGCSLEELCLDDCRLLERCAEPAERLRQLAAAIGTLPSLHTLSLAHNRLAKHVCVLAQLFSGPPLSAIKRLNISSNFVQPADLLEFSKALRAHRPPHRLTLDLSSNPGDRDPHTWNAALSELRPFCLLLLEGWKSTNAMADHISNM